MCKIDTFCDSLQNIISSINTNKSIYVCGDFNVDLIKNKFHTNTGNFLDMMYSLGMYPLPIVNKAN